MHTLCCEAASEYKTGAVGVYACLAAASVVDASSFRPSPSSPSVPPLAGFPTDSAAEKDCRTEGAEDTPNASTKWQDSCNSVIEEPSAECSAGSTFVHSLLPECPAPKRPRLDGMKALVRTQPDGYEGPPPPDEVAQAYALLNLPLSALRSDVQRRSRALARERHPDKAPPDQRVRATRLFRQLQDAKEIILSWLQQRNVPVLDESDDSPCLDSADECEEEPCRPPDVVFGEAGDVLADFDQDGSGGESAQEDEKAACVYKGRGDSPDTLSSSESGDEKAETALALRSRGIVRTEDSALVQATALSHFMASQRRRPQEMCSECFQRKVSRGSDLCSECHDEISQLRKCLRA
ncbi:NAA25 [Symbiodinium necroappetens]|uniref:NAA25 protein n=1 Tax=Symbiodinium necroappetens TaxID=1628268 RepID=A0A812TI60_9DINO|nr:NAA25 [Symbiodinium necroappetens]